jgi:hypothetical protein
MRYDSNMSEEHYNQPNDGNGPSSAIQIKKGLWRLPALSNDHKNSIEEYGTRRYNGNMSEATTQQLTKRRHKDF